MDFKNIDNWKSTMKTIAKNRNLNIQDVQQRYVLEEFAVKISKSNYKDQLIFKGGFVVSTLLGLNTRMTRDIDMTSISNIYNIEDITEIITDITRTNTHSFFHYELVSIRPAQEDDHYSGFVVVLKATLDRTEIKFKLDISNNTLIYPEAIDNQLKSLFSDETIKLNTYLLENIIAEKYETTLDRGEFNGRIRDIVDIYLLMKNNAFMIDNNLLATTIVEVSKDRETIHNLADFKDIIDTLRSSVIFNENFNRYMLNQYPFMNIKLNDIFIVFENINEMVQSFLDQ